jgi:DNA polymerase-3 subunit gamma/tau
MSDYIVSARKYRPDSFETLIGQDNIAQTLKNSIIRGKLAHAYLFCGPRGVGKTTTARIFAKTINCAHPSKDMEPCGVCESCISFQEGRSYCIHELDAASNNGVDDMKTLIDQVRIPPQVGKYSVFIIDEVHMLSTAAFNAFLKTLEEPPAHAIFILATTEKHKILPTILSRCQTYDFNRISVPDIVLNLKGIAKKEQVKIDDESLHVIAQKADGAMRDALTIFDQTVAFCGTTVRYEEVLRSLNVLDYDYSFSLVEAFLSGDYRTALLKFDEILSKGFNALHFVAALSSHFRNLIVSGNGGLDALLELPESLKKRYFDQAGKCSLSFLYEALEVTTQCEAGYKFAVNPRLHIEFALMKLCFLSKPLAKPVAAHTDSAGKTAPVQIAEEASAPAPKKSAEPVPVASRPRKKPIKTGASLSLNSIAEEEASKTGDADPLPESETLPTDEAILEGWKQLPELYRSTPRLATMLATAKVRIVTVDNRKELIFRVLSQAQEKWIREKQLHSLEGNLQKKVGSAKLRLDLEVVPQEEKEKQPYTDQEKATALMEKNGEVKNMVKDFGLETK